MKKMFGCSVALALTLLSGVAEAKTTSLKKTLMSLKEVPIEYGSNNFKLGSTPISIVRANLPSDVAGQGDIYTVMYQHGGKWLLAQYPDHTFNTTAWPHTEEDAVSAVMFFVSDKAALPHSDNFYLLKAHRAFGVSIPDPGIATFELYKLQENTDFGFLEFQETGHLKTAQKYNNIKCAAKEELGISLPDSGGADNRCAKD